MLPVVREFIRSFNEGDIDGLVSTLHPEIELHSNRGLRRGHEEARSWATRAPGGVQQTIVPESGTGSDPEGMIVVQVARVWHWAEDGSFAGKERLDWIFELTGGQIRSWRPRADISTSETHHPRG
jgi:limonene-1,2-epoxide hydrolase